MELEKRTAEGVDASRTSYAALAFAREAGKESSLGAPRDAWSPKDSSGLARQVTRWILHEVYVTMRSRQFGCEPGTCGGFCDKVIRAICLKGHILLLTCVQFGG